MRLFVLVGFGIACAMLMALGCQCDGGSDLGPPDEAGEGGPGGAASTGTGGTAGGAPSPIGGEEAGEGGPGGAASTGTGGTAGEAPSPIGGAAPDSGSSAGGVPHSGSGGAVPDGGPIADASGDRPVPGPECIAPCIWELIEPCRPTGPCTRTVDGSTIYACYADGATTVATSEHRYDYMPDGSLCYSVDYATDGGQVWHDGNGTVVATLTRNEDGSETVACGGDEYRTDIDTPECQAALDAPECINGECTVPWL
jgi:hypothetical protein